MPKKTRESLMIKSFAAMLANDYSLLKYLEPEFLNDKEFIVELMNYDGKIYKESYRYLPESVRDTKEVVLAAVSSKPAIFYSLADKWKTDKTVVYTVLTKEGEYLEDMYSTFQNDKKAVLLAVKSSGTALRYASSELCADKEVGLAAVMNNLWSLQYLSNELKDDKQIVLVAVTQNGHALQFASDKIKNDKDIVLAAVTQSGYAIYYASVELKNDREIALAAVIQNHEAVEHVNEQLTQDPVIQFIVNNKESISESDWPLVKRALLEQSEKFLNPPAIIKELAGELENKYFIYAQHALFESCDIENVELPVFE